VSLRSVQLPEEIDRIYASTFYRCKSLQSIEIPETVDRIENYAFGGCQSLTGIEIPEAVERIGGGAFSGCKNLKSIEISKNVEQIGGSAFANSGLESITVAEDNANYCALSGSLYTKDKTQIIQYAGPKTETEFIVPASVTEIGSGAFSGADHLTGIILPAKLEFIDYDAFYNCKGLTSIVIPSGVIEIAEYAFDSCLNLKKIELPLSLSYIGEDAFHRCRSLTEVVYEGTAEMWEDIEIEFGNDALLDANIQYLNKSIYMGYDAEMGKIFIVGNNESGEATLHVAAYKGNELVSYAIRIVPVLNGGGRFDNPLQNLDDVDRILLMLWDGTSMTPVAKTVEQNL